MGFKGFKGVTDGLKNIEEINLKATAEVTLKGGLLIAALLHLLEFLQSQCLAKL